MNILKNNKLCFKVINSETETTLLCDIGRLKIDKVKKETSYIWKHKPTININKKLMALLSRFKNKGNGFYVGSISSTYDCLNLSTSTIFLVDINPVSSIVFDDDVYTQYLNKKQTNPKINFNDFISNKKTKKATFNMNEIVKMLEPYINGKYDIVVEYEPNKRALVENIFISQSIMNDSSVITVDYKGGYCVFTDVDDLKQNLIVNVKWWVGQ